MTGPPTGDHPPPRRRGIFPLTLPRDPSHAPSRAGTERPAGSPRLGPPGHRTSLHGYGVTQMQDNLVSGALSDADLQDIHQAIERLRERMPFLIDLSGDEKRAL